ncbi:MULTISPECIES: ABC transporter ATP-binding protein [Paenibacillus]|jgi:NitT/TauT family transport system ATP-binding protein|uniref:ABC transporter ATP-binding protein n=1 Tax=Paenibacillus TaxID=44249 RepID=UPI0004F66D6C|nr:ABC transporter ATP-binding protein [Paenibacillus odorifer]AIQ75853.1 nitrate ABC transporter ATP-binding protein [Paenibacillus odorifer]OMD17570.1 nitrate ABC transporter ATP-binding protein [Paenibacillus odorifer]
MPTIELRNINKEYSSVDDEQTLALKNINLQVSDGEFVCVLGPSGCGKSTLLEIVAGLLKQSTGEIILDGKVQSGTSRDIGVVFQDSALFPWRTIRRNIEFGLEIAGVPRSERRERAIRTIDLVGLGGFADKYPHQLSGGMRQRAGLARTLVADPQVILMDEPFSAVDHLTRLTLQDEIIRIWQQEKKTVFFITHDVAEAVYLATRIVLLSPRPGRIHKIFDVPFERPRSRNDAEILNIVEKIYISINNPPEDQTEYFI